MHEAKSHNICTDSTVFVSLKPCFRSSAQEGAALLDGVWGSTPSRAGVAGFLGKEEDRLLYLLYPQNFSSAPNGCVSQSLSVLADINLHLLLPLLILVFCTHPVPWVRRGSTMKKCQISSKLKILPLTRACMQRSKAAFRLCAFVSAVTHA